MSQRLRSGVEWGKGSFPSSPTHGSFVCHRAIDVAWWYLRIKNIDERYSTNSQSRWFLPRNMTTVLYWQNQPIGSHTSLAVLFFDIIYNGRFEYIHLIHHYYIFFPLRLVSGHSLHMEIAYLLRTCLLNYCVKHYTDIPYHANEKKIQKNKRTGVY